MIDAALVKKLAALSRLKLSEAEEARYAKEMEQIVEYVGAVSAIEPVEMLPEIVNVFRDDEHPRRANTFSEKLIHEMPQKEGRSLKVKKILG